MVAGYIMYTNFKFECINFMDCYKKLLFFSFEQENHFSKIKIQNLYNSNHINGR